MPTYTEKQQHDARAFAAALGPDAPAGLEAYLRGIGSGKAGECETCLELLAQRDAWHDRWRSERESANESIAALYDKTRTLEAECASLAGRLVDVTRGDGRKGNTDAFQHPCLWAMRGEKNDGCANPDMLTVNCILALADHDHCRGFRARPAAPRLCNTDAARVEAERLDGKPLPCAYPERYRVAGGCRGCPSAEDGTECIPRPASRDRPATLPAIPGCKCDGSGWLPAEAMAVRERCPCTYPVTRAELRALLAACGLVPDPDDPLSKHLTMKRAQLKDDIAAWNAAAGGDK